MVHVQQSIERGRVIAWIEPPPPAASSRRVDEDDGVAGDRCQRVGPAQVDICDVVTGHCEPHRVHITADDTSAPIPQRGKLCADRTRRVVHAEPGQPTRPVGGDRFGGGLLQRLVGEQPSRRVVEFRRRPAPQQRRLHQHGGVVTETLTRRGDVGDQRGVGQPEVGDFAQRPLSRVAAQICDVVEAELYDGLTPVTMTL